MPVSRWESSAFWLAAWPVEALPWQWTVSMARLAVGIGGTIGARAGAALGVLTVR